MIEIATKTLLGESNAWFIIMLKPVVVSHFIGKRDRALHGMKRLEFSGAECIQAYLPFNAQDGFSMPYHDISYSRIVSSQGGHHWRNSLRDGGVKAGSTLLPLQ